MPWHFLVIVVVVILYLIFLWRMVCRVSPFIIIINNIRLLPCHCKLYLNACSHCTIKALQSSELLWTVWKIKYCFWSLYCPLMIWLNCPFTSCRYKLTIIQAVSKFQTNRYIQSWSRSGKTKNEQICICNLPCFIVPLIRIIINVNTTACELF